LRTRIAAEVPAEAIDGLGASRRRSRGDRMALAAAREAVADAGLTRAHCRGAALAVGAVGGGLLRGEGWYGPETAAAGPARHADALRSIMPSSHAETLGFQLGIGGPRETVVMACASGAASLALAADLIRAGVVSLALAGGVDALTRICYL